MYPPIVRLPSRRALRPVGEEAFLPFGMIVGDRQGVDPEALQARALLRGMDILACADARGQAAVLAEGVEHAGGAPSIPSTVLLLGIPGWLIV